MAKIQDYTDPNTYSEHMKRRQAFQENLPAFMPRATLAWDLSETGHTLKEVGSGHPGAAAIAYVRQALQEFSLPSACDLRYTGMRRLSGSGGHHLVDGVVAIEARFKTAASVDITVDVPVVVQGGYMVAPEVLIHNGRTAIMAQSTFDALVHSRTIYDPTKVKEHMFSNTETQAAGWVQRSQTREGSVDDKLLPGKSCALANAVQLKSRGGAVTERKSGEKCIIVRDMFGTGDVYYVRFESDGSCAPINVTDLR